MTARKVTGILSKIDFEHKSSGLILQRRCIHKVHDNNKHTWSVIKHLYGRSLKPANKKYACFLLNISDHCFDAFERNKFIWDGADFRVAVDGSANYLFNRQILHTADVISGDFDSIDRSLITKLQSPRRPIKNLSGGQDAQGDVSVRMPQVVETPCQKETDFTKAVRVVMSLRSDIDTFFALYHIDGYRLDHFFSLINTLHLLKKNIFAVNVQSNNISWLLQPGTHTILKPFGQEVCSLVPLTGQTTIKTSGLRYNLNPAEPSCFGGLVSTSNICQEQRDKVFVETDREILWSIDLFDRGQSETSIKS